MKIKAFVLTAILASACGAASQNALAPNASDTPIASASAALMAVPAARVLVNVGGRSVVSPDGKWIARTPPQPGGKANPPYTPAIELYDTDGKLVRTTAVPTPNWSWMPDSSGLFVSMDAPQHPAALGVVDVAGGAPRATGLFVADETLTRDGKWILSEQSEGCCMQLRYPEIRIAPRAGGALRTLVRPAQTSGNVFIIGVDAQDRLVYRDGATVLRVPVAGGAARTLGVLTQPLGVDGSTSPDGTVILLRSFEPLGWSFIANDRITPWSDANGSPVEDHEGTLKQNYARAVWTGPHAILVRAASGELSTVDPGTGTATPTRARLELNDIALAHDRGRLLVLRGGPIVLIDLGTGAEVNVGIDIGAKMSARASALPDGGFILSSETVTYRID